jgi:hypothetical protein
MTNRPGNPAGNELTAEFFMECFQSANAACLRRSGGYWITDVSEAILAFECANEINQRFGDLVHLEFPKGRLSQVAHDESIVEQLKAGQDNDQLTAFWKASWRADLAVVERLIGQKDRIKTVIEFKIAIKRAQWWADIRRLAAFHLLFQCKEPTWFVAAISEKSKGSKSLDKLYEEVELMSPDWQERLEQIFPGHAFTLTPDYLKPPMDYDYEAHPRYEDWKGLKSGLVCIAVEAI